MASASTGDIKAEGEGKNSTCQHLCPQRVSQQLSLPLEDAL